MLDRNELFEEELKWRFFTSEGASKLSPSKYMQLSAKRSGLKKYNKVY